MMDRRVGTGTACGPTLNRRILVAAVLLMLSFVHRAGAQGIVRQAGHLDKEPAKVFAALPYVFYTDTFELAAGLGFASIGHGQPQLSLAGSALGSTNATFGVFGKTSNLQIRPIKRLFLDTTIAYVRYSGLRSYVPGNPDYVDERAGNNDSSKENFIVTPARDGFAYLDFRYLLPMGGGRDPIINTFVVEDGLLESGATGGWNWSPLKSGRSYIGLDIFLRDQTLNGEYGERPYTTSGLSLTLEHDNTDFLLNPSQGSRKIVNIRRDFGWYGNSDKWTTIEGEYSKFIKLGAGKRTKQRVLAFTIWAIDTPTWKSTEDGEGSPSVSGAPPYFEGARLGGLYRMRGYRIHRFHDKAAIYSSAEFRFIPKRSPMNKLDQIGRYRFDWWQLVAFAEVGRVSPTWSLSELHRDLKWDVGIGMRTLLRRIVIRLDLGVSAEGVGLWVMAGHAF